MQTIYKINGDVLHILTHGFLIPKKSLRFIMHTPKDNNLSILKLSIEGLSSLLEIEMSPDIAAQTLLELEEWLALKTSLEQDKIEPIKTKIDEFGLPSQPQNKEELELFLKGAQSFENSIGLFNRSQEKIDIPAAHQTHIDNKRVFGSEMFDLSD